MPGTSISGKSILPYYQSGMYNLRQHSFSYARKREQRHPDRIIAGFLKRKYRRRDGTLLRPVVPKNLSRPCHNIVLKEVDENGRRDKTGHQQRLIRWNRSSRPTGMLNKGTRKEMSS